MQNVILNFAVNGDVNVNASLPDDCECIEVADGKVTDVNIEAASAYDAVAIRYQTIPLRQALLMIAIVTAQ